MRCGTPDVLYSRDKGSPLPEPVNEAWIFNKAHIEIIFYTTAEGKYTPSALDTRTKEPVGAGRLMKLCSGAHSLDED